MGHQECVNRYGESKLKKTHEITECAEDVNLLGGNVNGKRRKP
jgi:hypothetical protein